MPESTTQVTQQPDEPAATVAGIPVTNAVAASVYYIVLGLVVWALGRRIIQSIFAGIREAKRERI